MKPVDEKAVREIGILVGQVNYSLNIGFLNYALMGASAKDTNAARVAAHTMAAAMGDGPSKRERDLAIVCHDELCDRICAGMSLSDAVASARFQEPGKSAFNELSELAIRTLEANQ